jgi:hypothetical protein
VRQNYQAAVSAAKASNPDWDEMDPEDQDRIINGIFEAFMTNTPVAASSSPDSDIIGPEIRREAKPTGPPVTAPDPTKPGASNQLKTESSSSKSGSTRSSKSSKTTITVPGPPPPGRVYVTGKDGTGLFTLPEKDVPNYLRDNPDASAYTVDK